MLTICVTFPAYALVRLHRYTAERNDTHARVITIRETARRFSPKSSRSLRFTIARTKSLRARDFGVNCES